MTKPAISIRGLWKEYQVGGMRPAGETLYDVLAGALRRPFRSAGDAAEPCSTTEKFWALRDINVEVQPGEVVGVIGRNGAGKSTLLKVLSRITAPTRGHVEVRGRLASLLEVGTGFHPELSGRENVFLNGAILGMSRRDIARKFDEIIAFAEIEQFVDTPVKRYSSGMYVRLAFSVAAHLEADVMIVDEVLAVGDARFQKRCMQKMGDVATAGRTVLFVSHNMAAVQRLCSRVAWLSEGRLEGLGPTAHFIEEYLRQGMDAPASRTWNDSESAPGGSAVRLLQAEIRPLLGQVGDIVTVSTGCEVRFRYRTFEEGLHLNLSVHIYASDDYLVLNAVPVSETTWFGKPFAPGEYCCHFELPPHLLNAGRYRIELLFVKDQATILHKEESVLTLDVEDVPTAALWHGRFPGVVRPALKWTTERLS